jgi:hypothetical protein
MAKSKLTLSIDPVLLEKVKKITKKQGKSLSGITEAYYKRLSGQAGREFSIANSLLGCAAGELSVKSDKEIREMYLSEKHG